MNRMVLHIPALGGRRPGGTIGPPSAHCVSILTAKTTDPMIVCVTVPLQRSSHGAVESQGTAPTGASSIISRVTVLLVAVGGVAGVLARYGLGTTVSANGAPWMIFAINVAGSFLLGAMLPWSAQLSEPVRNGIAVGFCGGFTTFSTVSVHCLLYTSPSPRDS